MHKMMTVKLRYSGYMLIFSAFMTSCLTGNFEDKSSGHVGCPPSEIKISNVSRAIVAGQNSTWQAECDGKTFFCSIDDLGQTKCTERKKKKSKPTVE